MAAGSATSPPGPAGTRAPRARGPRFSFHPPATEWVLPDRVLDVARCRVMGVLNLTPDSFSDGGRLDSVDAALRQAERMVEEGAAILDVGGESTRPGAEPVPAAEEIDRILPFVERAVRLFDVPVSVDTRKAEVARAAVGAGAHIVNDVSGLRHDFGMAPLVAETGVGVVLMHMRGTPADMKNRAVYDDVVADVARELEESVDVARRAGVGSDRIVVDPGIGFAKDAEQSRRLLRGLHELAGPGRPILVGPSRKSFLGEILGTPPEDRLEGTLAACAVAYAGGARIFRVHDVREVTRFLRVLEAMGTDR